MGTYLTVFNGTATPVASCDPVVVVRNASQLPELIRSREAAAKPALLGTDPLPTMIPSPAVTSFTKASIVKADNPVRLRPSGAPSGPKRPPPSATVQYDLLLPIVNSAAF